MHNNNYVSTSIQRIDDEPSRFVPESNSAIDMISSTHQTPNDSIYLTFDLPVEAVDRLRFLVNRNESIFKELGILSVQFDNDYPITIFEESEVLIDQTKPLLTNSQNDKHPINQTNNKITSSNVFQPSVQQQLPQTSNNTPTKKKTRKTISELTSHVNTASESIFNPAFQSNSMINQQTLHIDDANNFDPNKLLQNSSDSNDSKATQKKKKRSVKLNDVSSDMMVGANMPKKEKETKTENSLANNPKLNNQNASNFHTTTNQFTMPSPMLATLLNNNANNPAIINNNSNIDLQHAQSNLKQNIVDTSSSIFVENKTNEANDIMKSDEYKHIYQIRQLLANQAAIQQTQDHKDSSNLAVTESLTSHENLSISANKRPRAGSSEFESCDNSKRVKIEEQINNMSANNFVTNENVILKTSLVTNQSLNKNENTNEKIETSREENLNKFQLQPNGENKNEDFNQTHTTALISNEANSNSLNSGNDLKITHSLNHPCDPMRALPLNIFDNDTTTSASALENKLIERTLTTDNNITNNSTTREHSMSSF